MAKEIIIESKEIRLYAKKLARTGKYDLPVVARQTLTGAAVNAKKKNLPNQFKKDFTNRKKTFIKSNSKFTKAKGNNLNNMRAMVGIVGKSRNSNAQQAVEDLKQQEHGGTISGRSFVPIDDSRSGKKNNKNVLNSFRINKMRKNMVKASRNPKGRSKEERFVLSALHAEKTFGRGKGFVLSEKNASGKQFVYRINQVNKSKSERKLFIKQTPVYSYEKNRKVNVKQRKFLKKASEMQGKNLKRNFVKHAKKRFKR